MAVLRVCEERDSKGNTIRTNPTITYKQDQSVRSVIGRHDFRLDPNPDYHPPITAQVQNGKIVFFQGLPDTTASRTAAREISVAEVPKYIVEGLTKHPLKVRESRPVVYEVKVAKIGDTEVTETVELAHDGQSVTVEPVAPNLTPKQQRLQAQPPA